MCVSVCTHYKSKRMFLLLSLGNAAQMYFMINNFQTSHDNFTHINRRNPFPQCPLKIDGLQNLSPDLFDFGEPTWNFA